MQTHRFIDVHGRYNDGRRFYKHRCAVLTREADALDVYAFEALVLTLEDRDDVFYVFDHSDTVVGQHFDFAVERFEEAA